MQEAGAAAAGLNPASFCRRRLEGRCPFDLAQIDVERGEAVHGDVIYRLELVADQTEELCRALRVVRRGMRRGGIPLEPRRDAAP